MRNFYLIAALTFLSTNPSFSQGTSYQNEVAQSSFEVEKKPIIKETQKAIRIDGIFEDSEWADATRMELTYEVNPGNNLPAPVKTYFYMMYDDENIYFSFHAMDENPENIRAYITDRDNAFGNDRVGIYLDPFNTNVTAYDFTITAAGIQEDGLVLNGGNGYDRGWDAIWNASARITENGFVVEASIPFKSIRFPASQQAQTWRISPWRIIPRKNRVEVRSHQIDQDLNCQLCQFEEITGFEDIKPSRNIEILPTITGNRVDVRESISDPELSNGTVSPDLGLDVKVGLTNTIILNSTINPDFSQVEADAAQLAINNQFTLRFQEKRPFFLEGSEIFRSPQEVVFTRSISNPNFGSKITGKIGKNEIGFLAAQDDVNNLIFPRNEGSSSGSFSGNPYTLAGRYKININDNVNVGGVSTARFTEDYGNFVNGIDATFRPIPALNIRTQYLYSQTDYPDSIAQSFNQPTESFSGQSLVIFGDYNTRNWQGGFSYFNRNRNFRADAGFMPQVNIRGLDGWFRRKIWSDGQNWFTRFYFTVGAFQFEDFDGNINNSGTYGVVSYLGPHQINGYIIYYPGIGRNARSGDTTYDLGSLLGTYLEMTPSGTVQFGMNYDIRDQVDFSNGGTGLQQRFSPWIDFRVGKRLEMEYDFTSVTFDKDNSRLFRANVLDAKIRYNFTPRFFIRSIIQFRDTSRDPNLYTSTVNRNNKNLFTQWLLSYKLNPQSVLFLGYSDNYFGFEEQDFTNYDLTQTDRTFFFKAGYVWRL